jgi:hypothetical protein
MTSSSRTSQFLSHAIFPVFCSVVLGFIFFGADIFNPSSWTSQFLLTPITASVFYYLLVLRNSRNAYAGLFVMFALTMFLRHSTTAILILYDILCFAAIPAAVLFYFRYFKQGAQINYFYTAITMSGLYAGTYVAALEIHLAILRASGSYGAQTLASVATYCAFYGVLIGFAVGGGITLAEMLLGKIEDDQAETE